MNKEELDKRFDEKFPCRHHAAECSGYCKNEEKSFIHQEINRVLEEVEKEIQRMKQIVPKDPLDITPREMMASIVQPVYRPYKSNEESSNDTIERIISLLQSSYKIK